MHAWRDSIIYFWEVLTGVFEDDRAKFIRLTSFVLLLIGIAWSVYGYIRASRLSDTTIKFEEPIDLPEIPRRNQELEKVLALAQTVDAMRTGGVTLAGSLDGMNRKLFNSDPYIDEMTELEYLGMGGINGGRGISGNASADAAPQNQNEESLTVRAIMLSRNRTRAVVDAGGQRGLVVRLGSELPGTFGRVVRITAEGITVRNGKIERKFTISEIK